MHAKIEAYNCNFIDMREGTLQSRGETKSFIRYVNDGDGNLELQCKINGEWQRVPTVLLSEVEEDAR